MRSITRCISSLASVITLVAGCSGDDAADTPAKKRPSPTINEQKAQNTAYTDAAVDVESVKHFRTTAQLPYLDITAVLVAGSNVFALAPEGLMLLDAAGEGFVTITDTAASPLVDMTAFDDGRVAAAYEDGVVIVTQQGTPGDPWPATGMQVRAVAAHGSDVIVGTSQGLARVDQAGATPIAAAQGFDVRDLLVQGDVMWIATSGGVRRYDIAGDTMLSTLTAPTHLVDDDVRALSATTSGGEILAATSGGLAHVKTDGSAASLVEPGLDSLPTDDLLAVAERDGEVLTGHGIGATAMRTEHKDYYHSIRWILDERVAGVALGANGTRWLATSKGVSRITYEPQTLAERAAANEARNPNHWRMDGFVSDTASWDDEWDRTTKPHHSDHDNDGLWTHMQLAAWCFAYAATGEEQYYGDARKAMDVIQLQFDVPAETFTAAGMAPGFITRSLVRSDEGEIFDNKATQSNWHLQEYGGQTYYWKDDTSSDEYAGHFFGIPVFYDLCAKTDDERQAIRDRVHNAMSYIIDNDYKLIDLDGVGTLHGHWDHLADAVDGLNECLAADGTDCFESYGGGGWLNSIEVLGMLLASWHITGETRFYDEYERLAIAERYGEMVPVRESTVTVTTRGIANHSDHELASLAYFTLLRYEPNAERRAIWIQSIRDFYSYEVAERNPLEIAVMASAIDDAPIDDAALTLMEMPLDWREWPYDNKVRQDNELDVADRHDNEQFKHMFPYDELGTMKWNGNPYAVKRGSSGQHEQAPWPYLLPYWMFRYYGALR